MRNFTPLWQIETDFDQDDRARLARREQACPIELRECAALALAYQDADDARVFALAEKILRAEGPVESKAFALQFAVSATEETFDEESRKAWIAKWSVVNGAYQSEYCQYLQTYQLALGSFFSAQLREAERLFENCLHRAEGMQYPRGKMRSLFHLGLVSRDRGNAAKAKDFFLQAKTIAQTFQATRFLDRIEHELAANQVGIEDGFERLARAQDWKGARTFYLAEERDRRRKRQGRGANSSSLRQSLLLAAFQKRKSYESVRQRIQDPVVKERMLDLKSATLGLSEEEKAELGFLRSRIGKANREVFAVDSIAAPDVRKFVELLAQDRAEVSKKKICRELWSLNYDPILHDGKLYKLVHRARKALQRPDAVLNCYGAYRLNPIYLGDAGLAGNFN